MSTLRVRTREIRPTAFEIAVTGRLDSSSADLLEEEVERVLGLRPTFLHFDLRHLDYISSVGLGLVITTLKRMKASGGHFSLGGLQPPVRKVFEIAAALPEETVFASVQEADRYYDKIQQREREGGTGDS